MFHSGFTGGQGFGWGGFGPGFGPGFGHAGVGRPDFGPGFGRGRKKAAVAAAALLLDGPADTEQLAQRVADATDGAFTPDQEVTEVVVGLLKARGLVTVEDGQASLTEFGRNVLAWRGITSETAHAFLTRAGKFVDVVKIRKELVELAGLARTIAWSGTEEQKEKLAEAKATVLTALTSAKKSLYRALAEA